MAKTKIEPIEIRFGIINAIEITGDLENAKHTHGISESSQSLLNRLDEFIRAVAEGD